MPSEFPKNDPRHIWQSQPTEPCIMSIDQVRRKAQQHQTNDRMAAVFSIAVGLSMSVAFARMCAGAHELAPRLGCGMLSLWCIYFAYQAYRWVWPGRLAPDASAGTSLAFYRSELERRRDYARHIWRRAGLTFCFLGLATLAVSGLIHSLGAPNLLVREVPLVVLVAIWLVVFFRTQKRKRQKLQEEIEELRVLEREYRS